MAVSWIVKSALTASLALAPPPKRHDYWPAVPVVVVNLQENILKDLCSLDEATITSELGGVACEIDLKPGRAGEQLLLSIISITGDQAKRFELVRFEFGLEWPHERKTIGCVLLLPLPGEASKAQLGMLYHHGLAHCNGWSKLHEQ